MDELMRKRLEKELVGLYEGDPLLEIYQFVFKNIEARIPGATEKEKAVVYEVMKLVSQYFDEVY